MQSSQGFFILRTLLTLGWLLIAWTTFSAFNSQGMTAGDVFMQTFSGGWLRQFSTDFSAHLILMALWAYWREQNKVWGVIAGLLCILGGGLFSLAYILAASFRADHQMSRLLLGYHTLAALNSDKS